ncbi:MAG: di-heme enzyme [bacterium]|nr:di-heme enzyme [bacterium]
MIKYKIVQWSLAIALIVSQTACIQLFEYLQNDEDEDDTALNLSLLALGLGGGCPPYNFNLPPNFPAPAVPDDNCMSDAKVDLGRHLFYDKRLSQDESMSCASCHSQALAFADGQARPQGITNETHPRNAQHLSNVGYHARFNWANSVVRTLETQSLTPLFAESGPSTIVELGLSGEGYLDRFRNDDLYQTKFAAAFGAGSDQFNDGTIRKALASFQRTLISGNSDYDQFLNQQATISQSALRGAVFFNSEVAECFHCHGGFNFTDTTVHSGTVFDEASFHNNGIYSQTDYAGKPLRERGLIDLTGNAAHEGRFRAPSLRNLGVTFPYMHDGSFDCTPQNGSVEITAGGSCGADPASTMIGHIIDHYAKGATEYSSGAPRAVHPQVDTTLIRTFTLSAQNKADLTAFLLSLTDNEFLTNPAHSNPRPGDARFGP